MKHKDLFFIPVALMFTLSSCNFTNFKPETSKELYIAVMPQKTIYNVGETFTLEGIKVVDIDNGNNITDYISSIAEGYEFVSTDISKNKKVTLSKKNYKSVSFNISVGDLPHLEISSLPKTEYIVEEFFTLSGLVVTCNNQIVTDYSCNFSEGNRLNSTGEFPVIISKHGYFSVSFNINVYPAHALYIDQLPNNTTYEVGDNFSLDGLVMKDERDNTVTDYTSSIEDDSQLKYSGTFAVTISKETYESASFDITVNEKQGGESIDRDLKIYYINDTHGSFIRNESLNEGGMSYISNYIKSCTENNLDSSIILSGGDMFQGGYESNETKGKIMIEAMNEIGFDAMVLGNHEFDWGESYIRTFGQLLECPIISSNVFYEYDRTTRPSWLEPYAIITKGDLKIGIIGGAQQNLGSSITGSISNDFYFPEPNDHIKQYSTYLRQSEGCDVIIAAFHDGGFEGYTGSPTKFSDLTEIDSATNRKYVDAMFFAHDHNRKSGVYNNVPYLEAGCNGKNIGILTLSLHGDGVSYNVTDCNTELLWSCTVSKVADPAIEAIAAKAEYAYIIAHADDVIYRFSQSYSSDDFTNVVCMAMYWYVNSHKSEFDNTTIYFASHNTGGVRSDVNSGVFTRRDLIKVFPFDNQLSIQTCNSRNIANMENSTYYRTYKEGEPVYTNGLTKAISITYITEYKYAYNYQQSYINYDKTAKDALCAYLEGNINPNL